MQQAQHGLAAVIGVAECSKRSMDWLLTQQGKANAVVLVVGGASEALEARPGSTTLTLARRKGFARVALEHGYVGCSGGLGLAMENIEDALTFCCIVVVRF